MTLALSITMPLPPSANALTRNIARGGRAKTGAYKAWLEKAGYEAIMVHRAAGYPTLAPPLRLTVRLGLRGRRRDAGNCLKPIEDVLVASLPSLPDDRWNDSITVERDEAVPEGAAIVTIESLAPG